MFRRAILFLVLLNCPLAGYAARTVSADIPGKKAPVGTVLIAFAREYIMEMLVGQVDPKKHLYYTNTQSYIQPDVRALFTLFGPQGKIQGVHLDAPQRERTDINPWEWEVPISTWPRNELRIALGVQGDYPELPRTVALLAIDEPELVAAARTVLKKKKMTVDKPRITEAFRADLDGDGRDERIACANSDNSHLTTEAPATTYAFCFVLPGKPGKQEILILREQIAYKRAHLTVDDHERSLTRLATYHILAISDVDQDGREEISIAYDNRNEGPEVDLFEFTGDRVIPRLESRTYFF